MSTKIFLSENIKKYRKQHGWTQQKLAFKSGLTISVITKLEQAFATQPTIQTVVKIADALGVSLDKLVGRSFKK